MINVTDTIEEAYSRSTVQYDKIVLENEEYAINNVELDDDCYEENNIFGTAIAKALSFEIDSSVDLEGKEFKYFTGIKTSIGIEWIDLGTFITQEVEINDTTKISTINAMDYMLKTNIEYISELNYMSNQITLLQVAQEACLLAGIVLATTDFPNVNFIVDSNQFSQGTLIRQVISAIAQISGTVAKIRNDDKLYFITPRTTGTVKKIFNLSDYSEIEIKRATHPINLVSLGMSDLEGENVVIRDEESINENGENSLIINDNPFAYTEAKRQQLITAIFDAVKGFEYKAFSLTGQGLPYLESLDNIQVVDFEGNTYNSFLFRFYYKSPNGLETEISAPSITNSTVDYQNVATAEQIAKRTEIIVNKQEQRINSITSGLSENSQKIVEIEQTVDGINQRVQDIEDVTESVQGITELELTNCIEGNLLELHIYGNNTVFKHLYPNDYLYPRDDLYPLGDSIIIVTNKDGESIEYNLGINDVLRQNEDIYDEYILEKGQAKIIRRINSDGTIKDIPTEEDLGELIISLSEDTNTIKIKNYVATIYAKYAIQNDYTEVFATKVEMNSSIIQTAEEINLEVSKKVDENEVISKINQSAEKIQINANKISLEGKQINLTSDNIKIESENFSVDENGNMTCESATFNGGILEYYTDDGTLLAKQLSDTINYNGLPVKALTLVIQDSTTPTYNIRTQGGRSILEIRSIPRSEVEGSSGSANSGCVTIHEVLEASNLRTSYLIGIGTSITVKNQMIVEDNIYANNFVNRSEEKIKKNIQRLKDKNKSKKALDLIKETDICEFNYINDEEKTIGLVIGDKFNTPEEIVKTTTNKNGQEIKGIDLYAMISLAWKAMQEQQEEIEKLKNKLKEKEEK